MTVLDLLGWLGFILACIIVLFIAFALFVMAMQFLKTYSENHKDREKADEEIPS